MANPTLTLSGLPDELLEMIVSFVDMDCLLTEDLRDEPTTAMPRSAGISLKTFSSTCRQFRAFTLNRLFSCCKIALDTFEFIEVPNLDDLETRFCPKSRLKEVDAFLHFITSNNLSLYVKSLLLYTKQVHQLEDCKELGGFWRTLYASIHPSTITIRAPPPTLAYFTFSEINVGDAWAFQTPFHILQLRLSPDGDRPLQAETDNLFAILPWTHCTLNEGSSLQVYNAYEYHFMVAPSIFNGCHVGRPGGTGLCQLTSLISFDYIAIFPLYAQVIKILGFLFLLPNLHQVRTQLAPRRENEILEDSSDLWMEFENTYFLIAKHFVENGSESSIREFVCLDYHHEGLWESLGHSEGIMSSHWQALGQGHWRRSPDKNLVT